MQPNPISVTTKQAQAVTGLNKNNLVAALASVGVYRFKPPGSQYLYMYSDLIRGMEALRIKYIQEASKTAELLNENIF